MSQNKYCEMVIDIFLRMQQMPFDVYIKIGENYTKIFNKGDKADIERFKSYSTKGVSKLFILKKDRRDYINYTDKLIKKMLTQDHLSVSEAAFAVEEMSEQVLLEIYEDGIFDSSSLVHSHTLAKSYIKLLKDDVKVLTTFLKMSRNETYMVRHSIATAILGILLAKADNNNNDKLLEIICFGGLLHDIGMIGLPPELSETDRKLTQEEWMEIVKHPKLGLKLIENMSSFPQEVKDIILQHHENYGGTGYPLGLKGSQIYYPARVIAIADSFSALTTRRGGRQTFSPDQALDILISENRKYDPKLIKVLTSLLRPQKSNAA